MAMPTSPLMLLLTRKHHSNMSLGPSPTLSSCSASSPTAGSQKWWWGALKQGNAKAGVPSYAMEQNAEVLLVRRKEKPSWIWA